MSELVTFGETSLRLSPEGVERLETADDMRMRASGVESNVAVAASKLGAEATWLSKLPDSPLGHRVEAELEQHGIDTEIAWTDEGRQGLLFYEQGTTPRDHRRFQDRNGSSTSTATPGELRMDLVQDADCVFVAGSTFALSDTAAATAEAVLKAGRGAGGMSALDLDYEPGLWSPSEALSTLKGAFESVDVLIANEKQAKTVFDRSGKTQQMAHKIAANHDFEMVVITRSDRGALVCHNTVIHEQDILETEAVDPTGQHEAFTGAFLERILSGADANNALKYGVASGALTRTIPGAMTTVTRDEVESLVATLEGS